MKSIKITLVTLGLLVLSVAASYAQIKIGTNPTIINTNSLLEVESVNKGVRLPRIALESADSFAPLTEHVEGMIVYNTETAGTAPNNVVPGFYYNDGTRWLNLANLSVTTAKIDNLAVTNGKLAADAVTTDKILDGTILAADISTGAVTTTQILNGTIKNEDLNKTDIPLSGFAAAAANVDLGSNKLTSVKDPTDAQDAATKKYVDDATTSIKTLESGKIYLGNASNVAEKVTMSGDVTIDNTGVTTIGASKVLTGMIANGTIIAEDIATGAVTTDKILDGTILAADIASGGNDKVLVTSSTGVVSWIDKTGFGALADQASIVGEGTASSKFSVKDDGITTAKILNANVTTAKIADLAITNAKLAADAVTTDKILDGTILVADLANDAVETAKIKNEAVTPAKIEKGANNTVLVTDATGAVTWLAKDGFGAVADQTTIVGEGTTSSKFSVKDGGITTVKLADNAVETAKIKNDAVETSKIKNEAVTPAKIEKGANNTVLVTDATGAVTWLAKDGFGAVADQTTIVGEGTTASKFSVKDGGITTTQILDGTVATVDLADNAVTTAKILNANVTTEKIADANVTNGKLAADAVTTGKIANGTIKNEDLNKTDIPLSGFAAAAASVDLGSQNLINVKDPIAAQDAATKKYVDDATAAINTLANGKIYIGDASNVATEVTMTGDVTISNAGVTTIGASKVLTGMIADGTIITADLADNAIETAKIKDAAVTTAKILDANVTPAKIEAGANNTVLTTNASGVVTWLAASNTLTAVKGELVSTVNGIASTPAVNVLISADNGLTVTEGNVQLGGALTAATKITTDATKTLALEGLQAGANTDKMLVVDANGVIKTTSGRNVLEIVNKTASYTVTDTDHTILANLTDGAFTITLPAAAAANKGRVLLIRKTDETNNVLTFSQSIKYSESTSFITLNYLSTIRIQSDGTAWYKID